MRDDWLINKKLIFKEINITYSFEISCMKITQQHENWLWQLIGRVYFLQTMIAIVNRIVGNQCIEGFHSAVNNLLFSPCFSFFM